MLHFLGDEAKAEWGFSQSLRLWWSTDFNETFHMLEVYTEDLAELDFVWHSKWLLA